jgi:hypothetical protein
MRDLVAYEWCLPNALAKRQASQTRVCAERTTRQQVLSASTFVRRLRIALDDTARGATICLHRYERITTDFDSAEKAPLLGRTRGPSREEDVAMPSVGSIAAVHELLALGALRTEIGHAGSRREQEFMLCLA